MPANTSEAPTAAVGAADEPPPEAEGFEAARDSTGLGGSGFVTASAGCCGVEGAAVMGSLDFPR